MMSVLDQKKILNAEHILSLAKTTLQIEQDAIAQIARQLDEKFLQAVELLLHCQGRVVVSGIGKSGHIARKVAATLASTGTPAFFVHPAEAAHGDLGMITRDDVLLAFSNSGETHELLSILPLVKRMGAHLISITGEPNSRLAQLADVHLNAKVDKEACPLNLAPTASTTAALALADALAVCVLDARGFREEDFARSHPGGALGRRLLTYVRDVMRTGHEVPKVHPHAHLTEALIEMTRKGMAMTAIVDQDQCVQGIFTDGDLRRLLEKNPKLDEMRIADVMHKQAQCIHAEQMAVEAMEMMERHRINQLLVVDHENHLLGALHIHDLTRAKII